jgi:hypothetical protein
LIFLSFSLVFGLVIRSIKIIKQIASKKLKNLNQIKREL